MNLQPVVIRIPFQPNLAGLQLVERQRLFARFALDQCARLSGAPTGPWLQTPERVPMPRDGFHWSIAHKPRFAAAVIARTSVGIDIESLTPRTRDLSTAVASAEEWALVRPSPAGKAVGNTNETVPWPIFFKMWTAKEAALKANSVGIGGLKKCRLARVEQNGQFVLSYDGRDFTTEHFHYAGHVAACTCDDSRLLWHVFEGPIGS